MPKSIFRFSPALCAFVPLLALSACDRGSTASVPLEAWCVELESALRDRHVACGCAGEPLDDEALWARCESFDAQSLAGAVNAGEVLWNGALATSILRALDDCERAELPGDPVVGEVQAGEPCRVFTDVAGLPDDCVFGTVCVAPADGGEPRCVASDALCATDGDCPGGACVDGACVTPVCAAAP